MESTNNGDVSPDGSKFLLGSKKVLDMILMSFTFVFMASLILLTIIPSFIMMLSGAGVLLHQIYVYLKDGVWNSVSIIDILIDLGVNWASSPVDWVGIWDIFNKMPGSVTLFIIGLMLNVLSGILGKLLNV